MMTNDDRKSLEDRILAYGDATRENFTEDRRQHSAGMIDHAWSKVMDEMTRIQRKEAKRDDLRN